MPLPTTTPFSFWAGGSAWDSASNGLWVTTGQQLRKMNPTTCTVQCGPIPCPKSSPAAEATGLDLHDGNNQLWVIDSAGWITQCTNACPPVVQSSWNTGLALAMGLFGPNVPVGAGPCCRARAYARATSPSCRRP